MKFWNEVRECSKLTNQIEVLKLDLIRFNTETGKQMKPSLALSSKLSADYEAIDDLIEWVTEISGNVDSLRSMLHSVR